MAEPLEVRKEGPPFLAALGDRPAVLEQRARGADLNALATARARRRVTPAGAHVGHHTRLDARALDAPGEGTLDLGAHPHAAHAHDAPAVVDGEERVTGIDAHRRVDRRQLEMVDLQLFGQVLQLAVIVGHAHRADVAALQEQHLGDRAPVLDELLGGGGHVHALGDQCGARRGELVRAGDLDDAQTAGARVRQPVQVAHGGNVDAVLRRNVEDRLTFGRGDVGAVDPQGVDRCHPETDAGSKSQTPAGQTRSTMSAVYSSRK